MSREIYALYENLYVRNAIHSVVPSEQEKISDFVRRIIHEKGLSYRKVAEKSGGLITHSTVSDVVNERVINLSSQTISGLAKGLGFPEELILAMVLGDTPDEEDIERIELEALYKKRRNLSAARKEAFRRILDMVDRELDRLMDEEEAARKAA